MNFKPSVLYRLFIIVLLFFLVLHILDYNVLIRPKTARGLSQASENRQLRRCSRKNNLVFLKTHKTAGTSIQNILLRYAIKNQLIVALPVLSGSHRFTSSESFADDMLQVAPWRRIGYNIFCHHMVFNETALRRVMPLNSIYITILRHPVTLFESFYEYSNLRELLGITLEEFAIFTTKKGVLESLCKLKNISLPRNLMLKDFGVSNLLDEKALSDVITHIDEVFALVMITEHFDKSVVLLKDLLCWDVRDVVGLTVNARSERYKQNLSEKALELLAEWNKNDMTLYRYFMKKFENKVANFGKYNMLSECTQLVGERQNVFNSCVNEVTPSTNVTEFKYWTQKVQSFHLKNKSESCANLVKPEWQLTNDVRTKQLWLSLPDVMAEEFNNKYKASTFSLDNRILQSVNNALKAYTKDE